MNVESFVRLRCSRTFLSFALCGELQACSDDVYVMFERVETTDGSQEPAGAGCELAFARGGGSVGYGGGIGAPGGDLDVAEQPTHGKFEVVVSSQGEELARRAYSQDFLLSGKRDTFAVTTAAGREFSFTYWGGSECEKVRQSE